ncbi:hypothetical protein PICSAR181_01481 [Mycobacterium avium subsp. paratuberculosis]|nr:hypothetical protein PICSAR14_04131 [Mycobacterium avium subsp. paratuberculosis]CAG7038146.1 hypothetical protein PICSAR179_00958 [Mycobacterium avium subsp. paratuberculosis]CAG7048116.1 hypothetical protein PICSAR181_01481 [Mycobacterium avium subsp. paratuberculosis]CAG7240469.1 hypothetical protein PICSAR26_02832 [Mycobacterium avium subsp. paratuberculosis]CAG7385572.1 hypothetical protein PICSAR7_03536 [Mycobacterium avium subsp. paratuberculosis]
MCVTNGRAVAPPWICCRIGVSTSMNPLANRVCRTERSTSLRAAINSRDSGLTARST